MNQYLQDIEYAASSVIDAIWREQAEIEHMDNKLVGLIRQAEDNYRRAENLQMEEDMDDYMGGVGLMWATYFGEEKEAYHLDKDLDAKRQTFLNHEFAIGSMSGALLQMAKQGISITHGGLTACPDGRLIGTVPLKQVVWQGRNQAIHFEEGKPNPAVVACFNTLEQEIDPKFKRFRIANLAFDIVTLLNWKTFNDFKLDMLLLA
jgi:hypothetical protein